MVYCCVGVLSCWLMFNHPWCFASSASLIIFFLSFPSCRTLSHLLCWLAFNHPRCFASSALLIILFLSSLSCRMLSGLLCWLAFYHPRYLSCCRLLCWLAFYHPRYLSHCRSLSWLTFLHPRCFSSSALLIIFFLSSPTGTLYSLIISPLCMTQFSRISMRIHYIMMCECLPYLELRDALGSAWGFITLWFMNRYHSLNWAITCVGALVYCCVGVLSC